MNRCFHRSAAVPLALLAGLVAGPAVPAMAARHDGTLTVRVVDEQTGEPIPARMALRGGRGRPVNVHAEGVVSHGDYFVFDGTVELRLRKGPYKFLIEAGPEYQTRPGHFTIERRAEDQSEVVLRRRVDMQVEGWWAGDLDVHQPADDLPLMMSAGGVVIVPSNDDGADIVAPIPFEWELPLSTAAGRVDAIQTIHRHALVDGVVDSEGDGRPRDKTFFRGKTGNGRYSEAIYHHLLNCGQQIPPGAGSGSGANDNPVGANRVYVHCGKDFSRENWFAGLRAGAVMVTGGPLLRTSVVGYPPGHVFELNAGETREFQIALSLSFYEKAPVEYLEIVKNGRVIHDVRLDDLARDKGRLPPVPFDNSGWFLVRAMTSSTKTYQYASTGPYYVQSGQQPRVSRASVQYFLDWLDEAADRFADNEAVLSDIEAARPFWQDLHDRATVD